jgi:hypothetical protein
MICFSHKLFAACALATVVAFTAPQSEAATVVTLSAPGEANQTLVGGEEAFFSNISIGNFLVKSLDILGFSGPGSSGQVVKLLVQSFVPAGGPTETLTMKVLSNLLYVGDDVAGIGTPPGTEIEVSSQGLVTGLTDLLTVGSTSKLTTTSGPDLLTTLIAGGAVNNPAPGTNVLLYGTKSAQAALFEETPFEIETTFVFTANAPGFAYVRSSATVVPLPASLPLMLAGLAGLGLAARRLKGGRPAASPAFASDRTAAVL